MKRFMAFMVGVIMGAMVGSTIAVLLAPASGEDLRNQLQERIARLQEEIRKAAADRRTELEEQLATLRAPQKPEA
jgi:gas vesicle protein